MGLPARWSAYMFRLLWVKLQGLGLTSNCNMPMHLAGVPSLSGAPDMTVALMTSHSHKGTWAQLGRVIIWEAVTPLLVTMAVRV